MKDLPTLEHHEMVFVQSHPSGADEFHCPTCGRRLLLQYPPDYKKIVLEAGDVHALHNGAKGGLRLGAPQASQESVFTEQDEQRLGEWDHWLGQMDFDNLWSC